MRQYFSDMKVGDDVRNMPIIFKAVTARKTGGGKPYLNVEVFDGRDTLVGNYWDWSGINKPNTNNTVYAITFTISEYQSKKQLTIHSINTATDTPLTDFQPSSGLDVAQVYNDALAFITDKVNDDILRDLALGALDIYKNSWLIAPGAVNVHHAYVGGTLIHSLSVARIAAAITSCIPQAHKELCIVGAMLHDLGKLDAYAFDGVTPIMTDRGKLFEHAQIGVDMLSLVFNESVTPKTNEDLIKLDILKHIILSHHGLLEHGAVVVPQCIEAHIVHMADKIDATNEMIVEASAKTENFWTDRIWALNNREAINYRHIQSLAATTYDDDQLEIVESDDAVVAQ